LQTASALTQSVCPLNTWNGEFPFHIFIVLSADPVNTTKLLTQSADSSISTAQIAAVCPDRVRTEELSCHTLAVLSHDPLNKKFSLDTTEQTKKKVLKYVYNKELEKLYGISQHSTNLYLYVQLEFLWDLMTVDQKF
jgi:hypothetical protein